jgi:hypothetical protein
MTVLKNYLHVHSVVPYFYQFSMIMNTAEEFEKTLTLPVDVMGNYRSYSTVMRWLPDLNHDDCMPASCDDIMKKYLRKKECSNYSVTVYSRGKIMSSTLNR